MLKGKLLFEWDDAKEEQNFAKHNVSFEEAKRAFDDPNRFLMRDTKHSQTEQRYYCFGKVQGDVMTVRFTLRNNKVRIIGAAYWRDGRKVYEKENR